MIIYQTQKKKRIISVLLLAEKSHNSVFLVYGLLTDTRNRYYTLTVVTTAGLHWYGKALAHAVVSVLAF